MDSSISYIIYYSLESSRKDIPLSLRSSLWLQSSNVFIQISGKPTHTEERPNVNGRGRAIC
jgi:hypothetical protein